MINELQIEILFLQAIQEEIENVLDTTPEKFCRLFFTYPNLRQDLQSYVCRKFSTDSQAVELSQKQPQKHKFPYHSLEMRLQLESYIREGMNDLLSYRFP